MNTIKNLLINKMLFIVFIISINMIYFTRIYWTPYYNYHFTKYDYSYPAKGEDFIIGTEPHGYPLRPFVFNILKLAFPDNNLIFNDNIKPNLIVRSEHINTEQLLSKQYQQWNAPYITISGERWSIKKKRYRRNAPPIAELVSATPKYERQLYFPFIMWNGLSPKKIFTNTNRPKFLAYIASNCVKERDKMFALIKNKNNSAEALGMCSNPQHKRMDGSWNNLDEVFAQYNFGLAMENRQRPGYITEKILTVFRGGAIPIYWGDSETVAKYFNPNAFIDIGKFANFEQAVAYIIKTSKNPEKIAAMQREPIFKNNIVPDFFNINDTQTKQIIDAANFIRKEYFKFIAHGKTIAGDKTNND